MRKRFALAGSTTILTGILFGTLLFGNGWMAGAGAATVAQRTVTASDLQALFFVWASGTPAVQRLAAGDCARLTLSAQQCARVSAATRAAWLDMAAQDPSAVGRPNARPNPAGRVRALTKLTAALAGATNGHVTALLAMTHTTLAQISQRNWINNNVLYAQRVPSGNALVWGTSFTQSPLPGGLDPTLSPYVALPDAYLKYADWGEISNIPTIYQQYYAPTGTTAHWTVTIQNGQGSNAVANVPITDVGPWNEDDNWWDLNVGPWKPAANQQAAYGTFTSLPASCPVASSLAFADATSNGLVNGVCPTGGYTGNLRRIYYYLLYQHYGLPFFQSASYKPSGSFADGSAWPLALAQYCSEAAAATANSNGVTCYTGASQYNKGNGGWLRDGTYDSNIANQSSIDMSPAVDKALGWIYPSSGLVLVSVSALP